MGVLPGDIDEQDFYQFAAMLQAKSPDKQLTDPMKLVGMIQQTQAQK